MSQICSGTMSHDSCGTDTSEDTVLLWHRSSSCIQASGSDTVTVFISYHIKVKVELPGQSHSCCHRKASWAASCRRSAAESSPWRRRPGRRWCGSPSRTSPEEVRCGAVQASSVVLRLIATAVCVKLTTNLHIKGGWCALGHKLVPSRPRTVLSSAIAITSYNPTPRPPPAGLHQLPIKCSKYSRQAVKAPIKEARMFGFI